MTLSDLVVKRVIFLSLAPAALLAQTAQYVGSAACKSCHSAIYNRWSKTRMANVVRDPKTHPEAIIPDFAKPDPLVNFTKDDIAFVYGSKWKQRYFTKKGDDYYPLGAQWDVINRVWRAYMVAPNTDWWVPHYPADNSAAAHGPSVRRLPFGELQHPDQGRDRVERRLREVSRAGVAARAPALQGDHRQPSASRHSPCHGRVHPMPLARAAAGEPLQRQVLRSGRLDSK